jgi:hypothetical protein
MPAKLRQGASRAARRLRRLIGAGGPQAPLAGQFQPYSHTLPDRYPWLFEFARSNLGELASPRILSFGCSRGDELFTLRHYFPNAEIKGIDVLPENIEVCRTRAREAGLQGVDFAVAADLGQVPAAYFDAIFCLAVLCHGDLTTYGATRSDPLLTFEGFSAVIGGFERCLKPQGLLLLLTTNFRFSDTPSAEHFEALLEAEPAQMAPDVLFDRNNRLLPGASYRWVAFRKRSSSATSSQA